MTKRFEDLNDSTAIENAARRVLAVRLEAVRDRIAEALSRDVDRRHAIHALRVATRRAAAAADVFSDCLPRRVSKDLRRQLRVIRRAVGEARDWDVVLARLAGGAKKADPADLPAYDMLTGYALAHRVPAQRRLEEACPDYPFGFDRLLAITLSSIRAPDPGPATFGAVARPALGRMVDDFNATCDRDDGSWERLHDVRIAGKRLRYALELVNDCVSAGSGGTLGPALSGLQESLGEVNDSVNAAALLRQILRGLETCHPDAVDRFRGLIDRDLIAHEAVMARGRAAYEQWLREWRATANRQALLAFQPAVVPATARVVGRSA